MCGWADGVRHLRQRDIVLNRAGRHGTLTSGKNPNADEIVTKTQVERVREKVLWRRKFCIYTTLTGTPPKSRTK